MPPDNKSLEPFFNDDVSDADGTQRNLRTANIRQPLEGYRISDQEVGSTTYYGYLNKDGAWYIQKGVQSGAVINYTYKAGSSSYSWANRTDPTYASFDTTF